MRILHTSDWHLGRRLPDGRLRLEEQRAALQRLREIVEEQAVALVLLAGDVFDSATPSAAAEVLFYETMESLGVRCPVVLIAGNHDSPERLCAARPLALRHGVVMIGLPGDEVLCGRAGKANITRSGAGFVELAIGAEKAVIATLPYPSPARLSAFWKRLCAEKGEADDGGQGRGDDDAYAEQIAAVLASLSQPFRDDAVNVVMSHLFVLGGLASGDERAIDLGGAHLVPPSVFPLRADYTALGHLHQYQRMRSVPPVVYSGALLSCRFGERAGAQGAVIVDVEAGRQARLTRVDLGGRPMVTWRAQGVEEALSWAASERDADAWIALEIMTDGPITARQVAQLRQARDSLVQIVPLRSGEGLSGAYEQERAAMPPQALFEAFYRARRHAEPDVAVVRYFLELLEQAEGGGDDEADTLVH